MSSILSVRWCVLPCTNRTCRSSFVPSGIRNLFATRYSSHRSADFGTPLLLSKASICGRIEHLKNASAPVKVLNRTSPLPSTILRTLKREGTKRSLLLGVICTRSDSWPRNATSGELMLDLSNTQAVCGGCSEHTTVLLFVKLFVVKKLVTIPNMAPSLEQTTNYTTYSSIPDVCWLLNNLLIFHGLQGLIKLHPSSGIT